ncbi:hypothetical protein UFOVP276_138 [uncultured Caudovirales phage]|uniref:Uncharacterized protein n=1 Tax=uncultured Caudovirales phage TaxID=2100421 RepID=A0A6J5LNG2_9CAUD|nr:hypothetical protein UFOVP127_32 [uncultured Caudovirales phage]CAB4135182.1 hypothetical protein UFOVP276_138 [uncultured Caudovirales phage]
MSDQTTEGTTTLDPIMIRDIENLILAKQLADTESKLAQMLVQESARKQKDVQVIEASIMAKLEKQVGRKLLGKIELLDKEAGLCKLT